MGNTDREIKLEYQAELSNNSRLNVFLTNNYVLLTSSFDPTGTGSEVLETNTDYNYTSFIMSFRSNSNLAFTYSLMPNIGQYYNGKRYGIRGDLAYRFQPFGQFRFSYSYNHFSMPHLVGSRQTLLVSPRLDLTFNKKLFFTSVVQYNSQITNMNVNARLQWRFAPVSDLYIVYTDNYFTEFTDDPSNRFVSEIRNRALVAKVTYWLNI